MDAYINIMQMQLDNIKQSNKHMKGSRGEKGKLKGSIILASNIAKLERIIEESLSELERNGVNVTKCRQNIGGCIND